MISVCKKHLERNCTICKPLKSWGEVEYKQPKISPEFVKELKEDFEENNICVLIEGYELLLEEERLAGRPYKSFRAIVKLLQALKESKEATND